MNAKPLFLTLLLLSLQPMLAKVTMIPKGLSYDDVLLVPSRSEVHSRAAVSTKTKLSKNIELNIPLVSSNMDTVTEAEMAIAMAKVGGIGIIHRFNTIEQEVELVKQVKRNSNTIIENPITIHAKDTIAQAQEVMDEHNIKGLLVVDKNNTLQGILTSRDIRFCPPADTQVKNLMTSKEQLIVGKAGITVEKAKKLLIQHRIEKLPLINEDWTVAGLITGKDIYNKAEYPHAATDSKGRLLVGAAIGVNQDSLERARQLVKAGVDMLVIDIAHGHSDLAINMLRKVKKEFPHIDIMAGNVATAEGTRELIEAGADAIKVGVGPGSICTTRIKTGSGFPQLSAVLACAQEAAKYGIPVIADGGIRYSGDITKAIAAGASTVMLGSLLAGTEESPGIPFIKNGKKYKVVRGMASFGANLGRKAATKDKKRNPLEYVPEGVEALKPYKGKVTETIFQLVGGLRSGLSYCGVNSVELLIGNGTFVEITAAGVRESHSHDVQQLVS